ncbi:unnamed protein product [Gordionus sp. m RMFG-2023]
MVYILNVAEKNDAAKSIAYYMSNGKFKKREGFSKFNKIYEYDYQLFNQNCKMVMTSVSGHLMNYVFPDRYKKWFSCSPLVLFDAPIEKKVIQDGLNIEKTLKHEILKCKYLIIWTDCDREGENIGCEIVKVCESVKQALQIYRATFSEITSKSISRACETLGQLNLKVNNAVDARQEFDLRIGAAFTRFQTLRFQKVFPHDLKESLMSYGSCQFPTLGLVVERYKEAENFISEPFWKISMTYLNPDNNKEIEFLWKRVKVFDHSACLAMYSICMENSLAKVTDIKSKPKSKWRPVAMDTIALEKLASRKLRIGAKETMTIAEKLYQKGFISYPRTETNIFPKELSLKPLIQAQVNDARWGDFASRLLNDIGDNYPMPRNGIKTDKAHPPIHPIKYSNSLEGKEAQIYELVTRHFLACCSKDAQAHETIIECVINDAETFTTKGLMILERNYLDVYFPYESWNDKNIPYLNIGDTFFPKTLEMKESKTKPPPLLTESDLITLMEKHGIGTDATHAEHIETIKNRSYVGCVPLSGNQYDISRTDGYDQGEDNVAGEEEAGEIPSDNSSNSKRKRGPKKANSNNSIMGFLPSKLGMGLVEGYNATGYPLAKPQLRSELERDLKAICEGTKEKDAIFQEVQTKVNMMDQALANYFGTPTTLDQNYTHTENMSIPSFTPNSIIRPCPACNSDMYIKKVQPKSKDGMTTQIDQETRHDERFLLSCSNYPDCKACLWFPKRSILDINVPDDSGYCDTCLPKNKFKLVCFTFDPKHIPAFLPRNYTTCIGGCDTTLSDFLDLKFNHVNKSKPVESVYKDNIPSRHQGDLFHDFENEEFGDQHDDFEAAMMQNGDELWDDEIEYLLTEERPTHSGNLNGFNDRSNNNKVDHSSSSKGGSHKGNAVNQNYTDGSMGIQRASNAYSFSHMPLSTNNKLNTLQDNYKSKQNPSAGSDILCKCGNQALLLTTKKGANICRQFYKCSARDMASQCSFFQWADGVTNDNGRPSSSNFEQVNSSGHVSDYVKMNRPSEGSSGSRSFSNMFSSFQENFDISSPSTLTKNHPDSASDNQKIVMCSCNNEAIMRTVMKDGPNKGKIFYTCNKNRELQCGFFLWAPEDSNLREDAFDNDGDDFNLGVDSYNNNKNRRFRNTANSSTNQNYKNETGKFKPTFITRKKS